MNTESYNLIVAIYLRGERLDPDRISNILNVKASRSQIKGGPSIGSARIRAKIGLWGLVAQTDSALIKDHLDELFRKIGAFARPLIQIDDVEEAYLDIFVGLDERDQKPVSVECFLEREHVEVLNRLGLSVHWTAT